MPYVGRRSSRGRPTSPGRVTVQTVHYRTIEVGS